MGGNIFMVLSSRYKSNTNSNGTWEELFTTKTLLHVDMRSSTD